MEPTCGREDHQSQPDASHDMKNVRVASKITRELAYNTFVRSHLKYASVVWFPGQNYLEDILKKVQRRAARYDCKKHSIFKCN